MNSQTLPAFPSIIERPEEDSDDEVEEEAR